MVSVPSDPVEARDVAREKLNHTFPMRALMIGAVSTFALVFGSGWVTLRLYRDLVGLVRTELELRSLAGTIMHFDETLTMSARMAAATGDTKWEARYREFEPQLDAAIKNTMALAPEAHSLSSAEATDAANAKLIQMEHAAFSLVSAGQREEAAALLFGNEYDAQKRVYSRGMEAFQQAILKRADAMLADHRVRLTIVGAVSLVCLLMLIAVSVRVVGLIQRFLEATRTAEEALAQTNRALEERVAARTAELSTANVTLQREMNERARVEIELRQSQKLESVGRLASGIAHEINTPIQFVSDNVHFARDAVRDMTALLQKLQEVHRSVVGGTPSAAAAADATVAEEEADLPYVLEHLPKALDASLDGLSRVATIVLSMKEFAHPDHKEMSSVDLNHSIQSTLAIARNEYKYVAEVETDFGDLPSVTCHVGDVNQAILNIIVNASHAIGDVVKGTDQKGRIVVRTRREGELALIAISDTGGGIPEDIRHRIFDPFFTTKEVGRGTGQGLSIAHSVVTAKHGGELTFETEVGKGTTFFIRLPIVGRAQTALAA